MARPKKANKEEMATVKIENAFWKLLETERYDDITVLRICQESGTNRNSFYYHYKDIDNLAYTAFRNNADADVSGSLLSALLSSFQGTEIKYVTDFDPMILPRSKKIMLCASSDSVFLNRLVRDLLKQTWFEALSIDEELLTIVDVLQIDFIFSGLTTVLGSPEIKNSPILMSELSQTEVGKAAIAVMKNIAIKQKSQA